MDFTLIGESEESMLASPRVRPTGVICSGTHQRDVKAALGHKVHSKFGEKNRSCIFILLLLFRAWSQKLIIQLIFPLC